MKLFDKNYDAYIIIEHDTDEAVRLAAIDLQKNLRQLSGKVDGFDIVNGDHRCGILIKTVENGAHEAYTVNVDEKNVTVVGSDILGTVFGIYAFATKCLDISPVYRLTDIFPESTEELVLKAQSFSSGDRPVRFRGWFLNDEDLLTDFKIGGGHRHIDYRFYKNVMDESVLDMILEAALRLEINLVIPSSFVDIDNPDEEKLVETVCRRGLYVSQHHVEPMGVSYFGADNYMKKHGYENETVSFISNRTRMEEIWTYYAKKWAKYRDRVVWQLGLRGKADQAVWKADPNMSSSMEDRGAIITDAIGAQYDIIRKTLGTENFYSTATLWNEGSELYGKGYLKLPETTVPVFSDFGIDQMFGEDLFRIGYQAKGKYGIYYHAGFWALGPHLTEGCNPEKMTYNYRNAAKDGKLCYSVLNISNVRPLHISAIMNARLLRSPDCFDAAEELLKLDRELFNGAGDTVNEIRREYYASFADLGDDPLKEAADAWHFYYRDYPDLPFIRNASTDGQIIYIVKYMFLGKHHVGAPAPDAITQKALRESANRFCALYSRAEEAEKEISADKALYYRQFVKYPIRYMYLLTEWCVACIDLTNEKLSVSERKERGVHAASCLRKILDERKVLEESEWKNWHRGDKKIDIPLFLEWTERICEEV